MAVSASVTAGPVVVTTATDGAVVAADVALVVTRSELVGSAELSAPIVETVSETGRVLDASDGTLVFAVVPHATRSPATNRTDLCHRFVIPPPLELVRSVEP